MYVERIVYFRRHPAQEAESTTFVIASLASLVLMVAISWLAGL
ncbi:MAG TPA: hypothetical protein VEC38_11765 [Candidatus Binataceae bacterium]|nr:hypothetical protein [Candidatus Binataceae bacterium]